MGSGGRRRNGRGRRGGRRGLGRKTTSVRGGERHYPLSSGLDQNAENPPSSSFRPSPSRFVGQLTARNFVGPMTLPRQTTRPFIHQACRLILHPALRSVSHLRTQLWPRISKRITISLGLAFSPQNPLEIEYVSSEGSAPFFFPRFPRFNYPHISRSKKPDEGTSPCDSVLGVEVY